VDLRGSILDNSLPEHTKTSPNSGVCSYFFFGNSPKNNFIFIVIQSCGNHMRHQPSGLRLTNVELIDELSLGFRGSTRVQALRY
jgi:hypothetical protein